MKRLLVKWWLVWLLMTTLLTVGCASSKCKNCPGLTLEFQLGSTTTAPAKAKSDIFQVTLAADGFDWMIAESELTKEGKQLCSKLSVKDGAQVCLLDPVAISASGVKAFRVSKVAVRFTLSDEETQKARQKNGTIAIELLGLASKNSQLQVFDTKKKTAVSLPRDQIRFKLSGKWLLVKADNKEECVASFAQKDLNTKIQAFDSSVVKIFWKKGC